MNSFHIFMALVETFKCKILHGFVSGPRFTSDKQYENMYGANITKCNKIEMHSWNLCIINVLYYLF